ncbi:MAG: tryptophan--tRNA ligase [Dongiaceae bacterium]
MDIKKRVLTGDRPTGRLHLGHYVGSLANRVKFQDEYDTYILIADLHMLTTKRSKSDIRESLGNTRGIILDYIGAGIDPTKVCIYLQSAIPEMYELNTLLQNLATASRLARLPSVKEMAAGLKAASSGAKDKDLATASVAASQNQNDMVDMDIPYSLLGYPVLQAADILIARADIVPVGKDNVPNVEFAREVARRFNRDYGEVFPLPLPVVGEVPTLVGTDGQAKMSKSLKNAIMLNDDPATVAARVRSMYTDPSRIRADIPGRVEGNPVFQYHDAFNPNKSEVDDLKERYLAGKVSDGEVKEKLTIALNNFLAPVRERIAVAERDPGYVDDIVYQGTLRMRKLAEETLELVGQAMGVRSVWKDISLAASARTARLVAARTQERGGK